MPSPLASAPWPYNPAAKAPKPFSPLPSATPGNTNVPAVNDAWPPKWTKPTKGKVPKLLPRLFGKAAGPLGVYFAFSDAAEALRLYEYINGHPLLNMGFKTVRGWNLVCRVDAACTVAPWKPAWTVEGAAICSAPF